MDKLNCWGFMHCGREPGGKNARALGVCPAASDSLPDGLNGGRNGGRSCWIVRGTLCGGMLPSGYGDKLAECGNCEFRRRVEEEEGAESSREEMLVDFERLPIRPGARMQIQPVERSHPGQHYYGRYVGAVPGKSIIVVTPDDLLVHTNQELIIRIFSGRYAYAFYVRLLYSHCKPFAYSHLTFPSSVRARRVRDSIRVRADIDGQLVRLGHGDATSMPVVIRNISITGAAVESEQFLGEEGCTVSLSFSMHFEEVETEIMIKGRIRNVHENLVGVEFDDMATADRLVLHYFVDYRIAENGDPQ